MAISDEALMEQFRSGDEEAFNLLIKRYEKPLFNMIYRFVGHYQTTDELSWWRRRRVENHLEKCRECQGELELLRKTRAVLHL
ncbi:MAG: zf-HC2 domain-containing protein [Candidatus Tectomicrobia bacterium]|nr:zf-HC2 domain-containing protein [Candidatus Tectomicrobia bacterium]